MNFLFFYLLNVEQIDNVFIILYVCMCVCIWYKAENSHQQWEEPACVLLVEARTKMTSMWSKQNREGK